MKFVSFLMLCIFIVSCNQIKSNNETYIAPTVKIKNERFYSPYCIYFLNKEDSISVLKIKNIVLGLLPNYKLVDSTSNQIEQNEYSIVQFSNPKSDYPAPDIEYLKHSAHALTQEEMEKLQYSPRATLITFFGTSENVIADHVQINSIIDSLIKPYSAIVTDYVTYESFNKKSWNSDRVSNFNKSHQDITSQFTIHVYRETKFCRAVTLGMGKFCLPDISINDISCNDRDSYANLINLLGQTWLEEPKIIADSTIFVDIGRIKNDSVKTHLNNSLLENAQKKATIRLKSVAPKEGDSYNNQFQIIFNQKGFSSPQEEQQTLISKIFGSIDEIEYINHDDEILAASKRAKQKLPKLQNLFNEGLEPGYSLLLKAPFETDDGGTEWMWIEVSEWTNSSITGILQNDPFEISGLVAGAIVKAKQEDIFDYIYYLPDGTSEGNETGVIMSRNK